MKSREVFVANVKNGRVTVAVGNKMIIFCWRNGCPGTGVTKIGERQSGQVFDEDLTVTATQFSTARHLAEGVLWRQRRKELKKVNKRRQQSLLF